MSASLSSKMFSYSKLRYLALNSFGKRFCSNIRVPVKELLLKQIDSTSLSVSAKGWIKHVRKQKQYVFCSLVDGSCPEHLQVVAAADACPSDLGPGCSVHIQGDLVESPKKGQRVELQAKRVEILGPCNLEEFPVQQKVHYALDHMRGFQHLRVRTEFHQMLLRVRNAATMAVHKYFQDNGFLFIHTPVLTANDCEGAGEMFHVKTSEDKVRSPPDQTSTSQDTTGFFEHPAFLTVSGQLHLEIITGAFSKTYNFGPTFRAEKSPGRHHLAEFYMIEGEIAFTETIESILEVMEGLVTMVTKEVLDQHEQAVSYLWERSPYQHQPDLVSQLLKAPFVRLTYTEAIQVLQKNENNFQITPKWGCDLAKEHEKFLVKYCDNRPVFVTDFPAHIKPFYARQNPDNNTVSAVDLLVPEVGELIGGSLREERYDILKSQLERLGLENEYLWYLDLRKFGSVPHGGFGLGFERYLQCLLGIYNIKDTIPFPRWVGHCAL